MDRGLLGQFVPLVSVWAFDVYHGLFSSEISKSDIVPQIK